MTWTSITITVTLNSRFLLHTCTHVLNSITVHPPYSPFSIFPVTTATSDQPTPVHQDYNAHHVD
jgi:hypothetical protein